MSSTSTFRLYLETLKHLKWQQVFYRVWYRLIGQPTLRLYKTSRADFSVLRDFITVQWRPPELTDKNHVTFLNQKKDISLQTIWNDASVDKLWLYKLHYFDFLSDPEVGDKSQWKQIFIQRWVDENPYGVGNGWEPYTVALRLVNWAKYFSSLPVVPSQWATSYAQQAEFLYNRPEYHLLGNHLLSDAKGLVFASVVLSGELAKRCQILGLKLLKEQVEEQFLDDGAHFELSPMYHQSALWDLLELIALCKQLSGQAWTNELLETLVSKSQLALRWLRQMTHPDGDIAFFNDSCLGNSPNLRSIIQYMQLLDVAVPPSDLTTESLAVDEQPHSGYVRVRQGAVTAFLDVAPIGADYQPGHGHADSLSFEMSLGHSRIFVNSGVSVYEESAERHVQRQTRSHNTVSVDNIDSSEVWGSFRLARRATVDYTIERSNTAVSIIAKHDGYVRLGNENIHHRTWVFSEGRLLIEDAVTGTYNAAIARLYLHPAVKVEPEGANLKLTAGNLSLLLSSDGGGINLLDTTWHQEFGMTRANKCIELGIGPDGLLTTCVCWA